MFLHHKKLLFRKFLMTSLHVICGLGPPQSKILATPMLCPVHLLIRHGGSFIMNVSLKFWTLNIEVVESKFYSPWFEPVGSRSRFYRFNGRRFMYCTTDRLVWVHELIVKFQFNVIEHVNKLVPTLSYGEKWQNTCSMLKSCYDFDTSCIFLVVADMDLNSDH